MDTLVTTQWLAANLGATELRVMDASFKMPGITPTAAECYRDRHIPGAVFFDIDRIADRDSHLPHMLPTAETFAREVGALGIGSNHRVVLYDQSGLAGAARAWWMFRVFGHERVAILDGGLRAWLAAGLPVDSTPVTPVPARFEAQFAAWRVRSREQILANLAERQEQVLDARAPGRFTGTLPEPWPGRRRGRIPGSLNLDHATLMNADGTLKPPSELRALVDAAGIDFERPIVTSCGSGITACVLAFVLERLGHTRTAVYDGSWAEWGLPGDLPIETGAPR